MATSINTVTRYTTDVTGEVEVITIRLLIIEKKEIIFRAQFILASSLLSYHTNPRYSTSSPL